MRARTKSLLTNVILVLTSSVLVLGAAEGFLRVFPQLMPAAARLKAHWAEQPTPVTRADPYLGFLYAASYRGHFQAGEVEFDYTTDEHGFRNPSPWPDSAEVVVVGDSQAFGYGVGDDSTWTSILARALPRSRVINLGLPGMAPQQYFRVYKKFGASLHPKLLVFGLFPGNDVGDQREFDAWLEAGSPGNFATWKFVRGSPPGLLQRALERTYLFWLLRITQRQLGDFSSVEPMTFADGSQIRFAPSFLANQAALATPDNRHFRRVMESIEQSRDLAHENGTAFLVLLFATKEDVYLPLRDDPVPQVLNSFVQALEQRGIPYLNLAGPVREVARQGRRLFFTVDGHPNTAGYRVIADAVLAHLRQHARTYGLTDWQ